MDWARRPSTSTPAVSPRLVSAISIHSFFSLYTAAQPSIYLYVYPLVSSLSVHRLHNVPIVSTVILDDRHYPPSFQAPSSPFSVSGRHEHYAISFLRLCTYSSLILFLSCPLSLSSSLSLSLIQCTLAYTLRARRLSCTPGNARCWSW